MPETDEKTRFFKTLDQMRSDGASDDQIHAFVMRAKQDRAEKASRAAGTPLLNPRTGMPIDTSPDEVAPGDLKTVSPGSQYGNLDPHNYRRDRFSRSQMTPEEERNMNAGLIGTTVGAGTSLLLGPAVGTRLGAGAVAALSGAAGGEASGLVRGAQEGKRGMDLLDAAAEEGSVGVLTGAGGHALGEVGGTVAQKLINAKKGYGGRFLRAKAAGRYETPEMQNLPPEAEGINEAAAQAHKLITDKLQANRAARSADYSAALDIPEGPFVRPKEPPLPAPRNSAMDRYQNLRTRRQIGMTIDEPPAPAADRMSPEGLRLEGVPPEGLQKPVNRDALIGNLRQQQAGNINPNTGKPNNPELHDAIESVIGDLGPEGTVNTVEGVLGTRRALGERANFGNPNATTADKARQRAYGALRGSVRKASPEVAAADDAFAASAGKDARARDIVYKSDAEVLPPPEQPQGPAAELSDELVGPKSAEPASPEAKMAVLKEQQGIRNIERFGDTASKPGREYQRYLEELAAQDPEYARALNLVGDKAAYEATRFGFHTHMPSHLGEVTAPKLRMLWQNLEAAKARGLYPAASLVGGLRLTPPFAGTAADALMSANEEGKKKKSKRAQTIKSGGHE